MSVVLSKFWMAVNGEDLSQEYLYDGLPFVPPVTKAEAKLLHFKYERCKIQIAVRHREIVGFLVYHMAYNCVLAVECIYVSPEHENKHVGKGLITSLGLPIKRIFFQTHRDQPPERFLGLIGNRAKRLHETGELVTWEMNWHGTG